MSTQATAQRIEEALSRARSTEIPPADACLDLARLHYEVDDYQEALRWCVRVVDAGVDYRSWDAASRVLKRILGSYRPHSERSVKLAVLGSYTTDQLVDLVRLVATQRGISLEVYQAGFGLYRQEVLDTSSGLYAFEPDLVLIAVHDGEVRLPNFAEDPNAEVESEVSRWTSIWGQIHSGTGAKVIQANFALRPEDPFGNISARLPGTRRSMMARLNMRLGEEAGTEVAILDCEHLASILGRRAWFDDRYWYHSKQAVGFDALPSMATNLIGLVSSELGLSRKCLVLDLDGTLWGGVVGEDGYEGIKIGHGPDGEAYAAFQDYILSLKNRGIILAVCSKNDEATAKEPFQHHPDMRLKLDDFAIFIANWEPKPDNLERIAKGLDLGTDALVFVDDRPNEREAVRQAIPEVDVLAIPEDPAGYIHALAAYPYFEMSAFTADDGRRAEQYRARAQAAELEARASTLEDFWEDLEMRASIGGFDELHMPRVVQLIGKTNQFNLTTRRHSSADVESLIARDDNIHFYVELSDRFGDHGLVAVVICCRAGDRMEIDTLLMSCRVIGRSVEAMILSEITSRAIEKGCTEVRGVYRKTAKNELVADLYPRLGFEQEGEDAEGSTWIYDLTNGPIPNGFISVEAR